MKKAKKVFSLFFCAVLIFSCVGCGLGKNNEQGSTTNVETQSTGEVNEESAAETQTQTEDTAAADRIEEILGGMSLEEKIGQMMVPSFRMLGDAGDIPVTELNEEIRSSIAKYHYGGTVLFSENMADPEQTIRLTSDMQTASLEGSGIPMIVASDQEGGYVTRLKYGTTGMGNMALAATGDPENARIMAGIHGKEMALLGINTDLAPVMDINNNPNNPIIGVRSFSDSPETVSTFGASFIEGLHENGVIATLKHFPGHGNTDTDSHTGFPCIQNTYDELRSFELIPFQAAIDAGADMVMTAHIQYPQIETGTYTSISTGEQVYLPATMSRTILTDILRNDMGFEGVIVTDALDMAAISDNFSREDTLCMTINAGANMLLLPVIYDTGQLRETEEMVETALRLAEEGRIDINCIDDSVRRILTLKQKYGLLDQETFTVTDEQISAAVNGVGSGENKETGWKIMEQALTLYQNENNTFPLDLKEGEHTLILFSDTCASRAGAGALAGKLLTQQGILPEGADISVLVNTAYNEEECLQAAGEADHVILVYRTYSADCLDPYQEDGFSSAVFDRVIDARHEAGKQVILISAQLPYDAARFEGADAILLTYGSGLMEEMPPESGNGSGYMPNLPAAICACFGMGEAKGQAPVTIPALDENYKIIF